MSVLITGGRNIACIGNTGREEYCLYLSHREGPREEEKDGK